ncbi:unnamed protein product [Calypogeia fissa]
MTKKLVADVAIHNWEHPQNVQVVKRSESAEKAREGPSNPLPVGLPAPPLGPPRGTPMGMPKGTRKITPVDLTVAKWPLRSRPLVTVEEEREATSP